MTTACVATLNSSFLAFPRNLGVSPSANAVGRQAEELQDISSQSITIGWHHKEMLRRLDAAIAKSSMSDWDAYGAKAVDSDSAYGAFWFARLLPIYVPIPDIYVDPDGEVTFEWYLSPRSVFSVTVTRNGELAYAGLFGVNKVQGVEYLQDELPDIVINSILRVFSRQIAHGTSGHS